MAFNPPLLSLPKGVTFNYSKSPKFSTIMQVPQSGRHPAAATLQNSTIFDIELEWNYLAAAGISTANDYEYLKAFYETQLGSYGWFLFDPSQYGFESMSIAESSSALANGFCGIQGQNNYLYWSQNFSVNTSWGATEIASITDGGTTAVDGKPLGSVLVSAAGATNAFIFQYLQNVAVGFELTFSLWMRVPSGTQNVDISIQDSAGSQVATCALTTSWQRFSVTYTVAGTTPRVLIGGLNTIGSAQTIYLCYSQCEAGPSPNTYENIFSVNSPAVQTWPLWRSTSVLGGGVVTLCEKIQNVTLLAGIYLNGALQSSGYTQTNLPSQVIFTSPPPAGTIVSWAGDYNYLVHFSEDVAQFDEFMYQIWKLKSLKLETINL